MSLSKPAIKKNNSSTNGTCMAVDGRTKTKVPCGQPASELYKSVVPICGGHLSNEKVDNIVRTILSALVDAKCIDQTEADTRFELYSDIKSGNTRLREEWRKNQEAIGVKPACYEDMNEGGYIKRNDSVANSHVIEKLLAMMFSIYLESSNGRVAKISSGDIWDMLKAQGLESMDNVRICETILNSYFMVHTNVVSKEALVAFEVRPEYIGNEDIGRQFNDTVRKHENQLGWFKSRVPAILGDEGVAATIDMVFQPPQSLLTISYPDQLPAPDVNPQLLLEAPQDNILANPFQPQLPAPPTIDEDLQ